MSLPLNFTSISSLKLCFETEEIEKRKIKLAVVLSLKLISLYSRDFSFLDLFLMINFLLL